MELANSKHHETTPKHPTQAKRKEKKRKQRRNPTPIKPLQNPCPPPTSFQLPLTQLPATYPGLGRADGVLLGGELQVEDALVELFACTPLAAVATSGAFLLVALLDEVGA